MHVVWHRAVGAAAVVMLCILDAAQSTPVAPKRPFDSTELYYGAHQPDGDDATSAYKPLEKKARTSSSAAGVSPQQVRRPSLDLNKMPSSYSLDTTGLRHGAHGDAATSAYKHPEKESRASSSAGGATRQHVGSPSSNSVSSAPPSTRQASSDAYESHSWNKKQGEASTSDAYSQTPRRSRSSSAQNGPRTEGEASHSSLKTGPATHTSALQTDYFDHRGVGSSTMAPSKLWHEPAEVMDIYSTRGVIKAKALAIQQHVPEYPTSPKDYDLTTRGQEGNNNLLHRHRQTTGHNRHVRKTYKLMAKNQDEGLPLLKGVPLMYAKDVSLAARKRRPVLPPDALLQDYRTLLSDDGRQRPGGVISRLERQEEARKRQSFLDGRKRAAANIKVETDARVLEKAIKVREHYPRHALDAKEYKYKPKVPMKRTSKEFQVKQRENWISVTNERFKRLGMRLDETKGESSSGSGKRKQAHRRRGGL